MRFPGEPASVPAARRFLAERAAGLDPETQETAVFLLSEVVTNAVLHARTFVTLRCTVEPGGVLVEVTDESPLVPLPRHHDPDAVSGRGLELVEMLATSFGVVPGANGKTVWFAVGSVTRELPAGWSPAPVSDAIRLTLMSVPVRLYDVLQQHNEAVLREYELLLLGEGAQARTRREVADAGRARGMVVEAIRKAAAAHAGERRVDVDLEVPAHETPAFVLLPAVLDAAEEAARRGRTLARPALPELLQLRGWLYEEITRQLEGQHPRPWGSVSSYLEAPQAPELDVDLSWVARTTDAVVVADDANRVVAVSPAAADLLGWTIEELVGRRVTALVPHDLREDHVTGFTRQIVTGQRTLIGREVEVPALRRDGTEIAVGLRLEREGVGNRSLYVARLLPGDLGRSRTVGT